MGISDLIISKWCPFGHVTHSGELKQHPSADAVKLSSGRLILGDFVRFVAPVMTTQRTDFRRISQNSFIGIKFVFADPVSVSCGAIGVVLIPEGSKFLKV